MINYPLKIKEYREKMLLTQEDLAKILGVSAVSITRWETGKYAPTMRLKRKLHQLFIEAGINLQ